MTESPKNQPKKKPSRKTLPILLLALGGVILLLVLLNTLDFSPPALTDPVHTVFTPEEQPEQNFYEPDDRPMEERSDYQALDSTVTYSYGGESNKLSDTWLPDAPFSRFFLDYFDALKEGFSGGGTDQGFNAFYSPVYFRKNPAFSAFSPQMVYDIEVERISDPATITTAAEEADRPYLGATLTDFAVRYKIYRNDGSFRRDIVDEMVIPQILTVLTEKNGRMSINSLSYYQNKVPSANEKNDSILPFLLPLIWLGLALLLFVVSLIVRKRALLPPLFALLADFILSLFLSPTLQLAIGLPLLVLSALSAFFLFRPKKHAEEKNE